MSKRHQSSRRKTYGRRQHEVRERRTPRDVPMDFEQELDEQASSGLSDRLSFLDPRASSLRFAMGD